MYKKDKTIFLGSIEAVLPCYNEQGANICNIIHADGRCQTVPMSTSKFIKSWFYILRIDPYAQRMWSREILSQTNLNPLVFNEHMVLIPIKVRVPIGAKDGSYGYIKLGSIEAIYKDHILLYNGVKIPHLSTIKTIKRKTQDALLLKYTYLEELKIYGDYNNLIYH